MMKTKLSYCFRRSSAKVLETEVSDLLITSKWWAIKAWLPNFFTNEGRIITHRQVWPTRITFCWPLWLKILGLLNRYSFAITISKSKKHYWKWKKNIAINHQSDKVIENATRTRLVDVKFSIQPLPFFVSDIKKANVRKQKKIRLPAN